MTTPTDNEAENAEQPRSKVFRVVRRHGDKRKAAHKWLFFGISSQELARYRNEPESGLDNSGLYDWTKQVKGAPRLALAIMFGSVFFACLVVLNFVTGIWPHLLCFFLLFNSARRVLEQYTNWVGAKAAALLAERGDEKALMPLARLWDVGGKTPFLTATGERHFEKWLTEGYTGTPSDLPRDLRGMVKRAFPYWRRFQYCDFSDSATDTLLAALRCLAQNLYNENKAVLRHVARFPLPPNAPNRALLREMAIMFLDDPKPAVPLQRPVNAAVLPLPSILPTAIAPPVSPERMEQSAALHRRI